MKKVYTFKARSTVEGTISVKADTLVEAEKIRRALQENNRGEINIEVGSGELFIDAIGWEDKYQNDGTHLMTAPLQNAEENMSAYEELRDELEEFNVEPKACNYVSEDSNMCITHNKEH